MDSTNNNSLLTIFLVGTLTFCVGIAIGIRHEKKKSNALIINSTLVEKDSKKLNNKNKEKIIIDASEEEEEENNSEEDEDSSNEPLKMVFVVNDSLKMGKGKIAAQCCHACLGSYLRAKPENIKAWNRIGQAKIVVRADDDEALFEVVAMAKSLSLPHYLVQDAGRTQIAAGSYTVVGIGPERVSKIDKVTSKFKLM